jgi:nucleoside recognition membrane protein YjiH
MDIKAIDHWLDFIIGVLLIIGGVYSAFNGGLIVFFAMSIPWWIFCVVGVAFIIWGIIRVRQQSKR